jgi:hypothetical protein
VHYSEETSVLSVRTRFILHQHLLFLNFQPSIAGLIQIWRLFLCQSYPHFSDCLSILTGFLLAGVELGGLIYFEMLWWYCLRLMHLTLNPLSQLIEPRNKQNGEHFNQETILLHWKLLWWSWQVALVAITPCFSVKLLAGCRQKCLVPFFLGLIYIF